MDNTNHINNTNVKDFTTKHRLGIFIGIFVVILLPPIIMLFNAYSDSHNKSSKLEKEEQKKMISNLFIAISCIILFFSIAMYFIFGKSKLNISYLIQDGICYLWFFVIYIGIITSIIMQAINISSYFDNQGKSCLITPSYKKEYTTNDEKGLAPLLDVRYNRVEQINIKYIDTNKETSFNNKKETSLTNNIANIKDISFIYYNYNDPSVQRTCNFERNSAGNFGDNVTVPKILEYIYQMYELNK